MILLAIEKTNPKQLQDLSDRHIFTAVHKQHDSLPRRAASRNFNWN
jgi:hypothetical protein